MGDRPHNPISIPTGSESEKQQKVAKHHHRRRSNQTNQSASKNKQTMGGGEGESDQTTQNSMKKEGKRKSTKLSPVAAPFVPKTVPEQLQTRQTATGVFCTICSDEVSFLAVGECNHPICSLCSLRLRFKSKNDDCAICKTKLSIVAVFDCTQHSGEVRFTDLGLTDTSNDIFDGPPPPGMQVDASNRMVYLNCRDHYVSLTSFKRIYCPCVESNCTYDASSHAALLQHLNSVHGGLTMCSLCLENRPLFMHEHEIMSKKELKAHMDGMEKADCAYFHSDINHNKFTTGHPRCEFCKTNFFDPLALYNHLQRQHFTCHLCDEAMMFRYYQDLPSLRDHHRRHHFMCQLCDQDEQMCNSDMCYSFTLAEDYRDHLRSFHSLHDTSRYITPFGKVQYKKHSSQHQQDARRMEHFDLDVGSANPFSQDDPHNHNNGRNSRRGRNASANNSNQKQIPFPPSQPSHEELFPALSGNADVYVPNIPPNMRLAGKISGTGRMTAPDESDLALQAMADAAHRQAAIRSRLHHNSSLPSAAAFPSLSSQGTNSTNTNHNKNKNATTDSKITSSTNQQPNQKDAASPAAELTVPAKPAPHPMSLVNRAKPSVSSSSSMSLAARRKQEELAAAEDKRVARNVALAGALGIASTENNNLTAEVVGGSTSHTAYRQPIIDALARYRLPQTVLFSPLYPPEMISWGKKMHNELCKVERRLMALLEDAKASSLALKPMKATDRLMMHCLGKYYRLHTYEYDPEPHRYVSMVKTVHSAAPEVLLSDACTSPIFSPTKLSTYLNQLTLPSGPVAATPVIYLQLAEGLVQTWGRSTDRKQLSYAKPYAFNSSMVTFAEVVLQLQELLVQYQQRVDEEMKRMKRMMLDAEGDRDGDNENMSNYEDFSLVSIAAAGPTALSIKFRDVPTAQMIERLLSELQQRATENANLVQNSTNVAMPVSASQQVQIGIFPYFRIFPDFPVIVPPSSEHTSEQQQSGAMDAAAYAEAQAFFDDEEDDVQMAQGTVIDSWSDDDNNNKSNKNNGYNEEEDAGDTIVYPQYQLFEQRRQQQQEQDRGKAAAVAVAADVAVEDYEMVGGDEDHGQRISATAISAVAAEASTTGDDIDDWEKVADQADLWEDFLAEKRRNAGTDAATTRYRPPTTTTSALATNSNAHNIDNSTSNGVKNKRNTVTSAATVNTPKAAVSTSSYAPDTSDDYALALALQQQEEEDAAMRASGSSVMGAERNFHHHDHETPDLTSLPLDLEALDVGATAVPSTYVPASQWTRVGKPTAVAPTDTVVTAVSAESYYVPPHLRHNGGTSHVSSAASAVPTSTTAFVVPTALAMSEDPALRLIRETQSNSSATRSSNNSNNNGKSVAKKASNFAALLDEEEED